MKTLRSIISKSISVLEQGAFQGFCLVFLRAFDPALHSLKRHGGTADDKTRGGQPDLIQTDQDGSQTAVQCSVEKSYWPTPDNLADSKPIKDVIDACKDLSSVKRVVLCSSQEIPTTRADVESAIIKYCESKFKVQVELMSNADFEGPLSEAPGKYIAVIKDYLPDAHDSLKKNAQIDTLTLELLKQY